MFLPYELEGKVFKKVMKGYNTAEVDEHIDFLLDKYKELYRAYKELEKKYSATRAELMTYKENEDSIRQTLESSRSTGAQMMKAAEDRSEIILKAARDECDAVIADFKEQIRAEIDLLDEIRTKVADFKNSVFEQYQQHIEYLESIAPDDDDKLSPELEEIKSETVGRIVIKANKLIADQTELFTVSFPELTADADDATPSPQIEEQSAPDDDEPDIVGDDDFGELEAVSDISDDDTGKSEEIDETDENDATANSGDTHEYPIITNLPDDIASAEDVIFGSDDRN